MNTKITYLYRDADNYKQFNEVIINGCLTKEQKHDMTPEDVVKQFEAAAGNWNDTDMSWMDYYDTDDDDTDGE